MSPPGAAPVIEWTAPTVGAVEPHGAGHALVGVGIGHRDEPLVAEPELGRRPVGGAAAPRLRSTHGPCRRPRARSRRVSVPPATPRTPRERRRPCARPGPSGDTTEVDELDLARLTPEATPAALAEWHRAHEPGDELDVHGRWFGPVPFATVALGAGTTRGARDRGPRAREVAAPPGGDPRRPRGARCCGCSMVGLNPSVVAAEQGVPFVGASNRFWPAALDAGLVPRRPRPVARVRRRPRRASPTSSKRASPRADGLTRAEYEEGAARLRRGRRSGCNRRSCASPGSPATGRPSTPTRPRASSRRASAARSPT